MNYTEITRLIETHPACANKEISKDALLQMIADAKAFSILQNILKSSSAQTIKRPTKKVTRKRGKKAKLHFTISKKEISTMSNKNIFACQDHIIPYRFHKGVYEARYRRNGLNVFACAKDFNVMKAKFLEKFRYALNNGFFTIPNTQLYNPQYTYTQIKQSGREHHIAFTVYMEQWLKLKEKTTKPSTYKEYERV